MPITIGTSYTNLAVKVNSGVMFARDKARLDLVPGKIPIYKNGKFEFWQVPRTSFLDLYNNFSDQDMIVEPAAQDLITKLTKSISKIADLPRMEIKEELRKRYDGKELRDYQIDYITIDDSRQYLLNFADLGLGKCHGLNTPILMYDGSIKMVQDIEVGDLLMGPDSKPRRVLRLCRGRDQMYKVIPTKGDPFVCNADHVLSLKLTNTTNRIRSLDKYCDIGSNLYSIKIKDYFSLTKTHKHTLKLWRVPGVSFNNEHFPIIDPYFLGLWLGDGHSGVSGVTNCDKEITDYLYQLAESLNLNIRRDGISYYLTKGRAYRSNPIVECLKHYNMFKNKHIPRVLLTSSREIRLQLLAGLLDSDGYYVDNCYEITQKIKVLSEGIAFLCRSLGFAAHMKEVKKYCMYKGEKRTGTYYKVLISGEGLEQIPCKLPRKQAHPRQQKKNALVSGFRIEELGEDDYYGFELDGDHLYLLGDFTVTHNSTMSLFRSKQLGKKKILIACPKPVIGEWLNSIWNEVLGPMTKVLKYRGSPAQRIKLRDQIKDNEIVITNYEMLGELADFGWDSVIMDEAHTIQNEKTTLYKSARKLIKKLKNASLQLLTATPLENDIGQLWNLLNLVNPDLAGEKRSFLNKYQEEVAWKYIQKYGKKIKIPIKFRTKNESQLKDLLDRAGVRLKKDLYINYIPKNNIIPVEMTKAQTKKYERVVEQILYDSMTGGFYQQNPLVRLLDLLKEAEGEGKVEYLKYRLSGLDKALVWSRFRWLPEALHDLYPATSVLFNGDKSDNYKKMVKWCFEGCADREREEFYILREKMSDFAGFEPGSALYFFGTYGSRSGAGLNLPSAQHAFVTSFDYSGRSIEQMSGRNKRLYSEYDEVYTNFITSLHTIEPLVLARLFTKIETCANVLDGDGSSSSLSAREVVEMIQEVHSV